MAYTSRNLTPLGGGTLLGELRVVQVSDSIGGEQSTPERFSSGRMRVPNQLLVPMLSAMATEKSKEGSIDRKDGGTSLGEADLRRLERKERCGEVPH